MRVTIEKLGLLVSQTREAMPTEPCEMDCGGSPGDEWMYFLHPEPHWEIYHDYATDDAAALRLFDEISGADDVWLTRLEKGRNETDWKLTFWQHDEDFSFPMERRFEALTRPVAICRAWLAWNGVPVAMKGLEE